MATDTTVAPLGSAENPKKFRNQDYTTLLNAHLKSGVLFSDPTFPAEQKSIGGSELDPDPKKAITWKRPKEITKNAVFVEGTTGTTDICQGQLGNCWLLAALSCLTMHPTLFVKVVPSNQSLSESYAGIFHFTFWQYGEWVEVVVDDRLPVREGRLLFSYSHTRNEFWSALVEKAYAKLIGSYASLKGGNISEGMEDFTGGIAYSLQIPSYTPQVLWRRLTGALSRGSLLSCFIQATSTRDVGKVTAEGLVNGHAYAITETDKVTKGSEEVLLLRVRNPWGFVEYFGPWSDKCKNWNAIDKAEKDRIKLKITEDGEFWISVEDFSKLFNTVELCNVNPESIDEENAPATPSAWVISEHQGFWATGSTAGGSRTNLTFWRNPQFKLVLKEQDQTEEEEEDDEVEVDDEDDVETVPEQKRTDKPKHKAKNCTVVVELLQKNRRQKDKLNFLFIGFHIYKAPPKLQGVCLDRNFFVKNSPVGRSGKYKAQRGVWRKMRLEPGNYIIVVSTFRPHQPGEFFVRIYSKTGNTLRSHDFTCTSSYVPVMATPASPEDQVRVEKIFDKVAGQDDMLNAMEFMQLVNSVFDKEHHLPLETCTQLVFGEDTNGRASLNRKQTETLMSSLRNLQSMFRRYDADSSGTMSPFELGTALEALGMQCDIKVLQLLSQRFASGQLQMPFHGFVTCFTRLRKLFALYQSETSQEVKDKGINAWLLQFLML
ncbi:calpain-12 isoform X2 [Mastacembelus armatus]|uniref:Calpain 12 n=2 Tax=Mastacembelus armatus TaxID=205130 RepID=A0A3Q3M7J2_9TELE|nr:calpain-2 catalytic subunit-like isoform X2 [Mastacembelus armatus]